MDADEVLRLAQIQGLAEMFADREFSQAWECDYEFPLALVFGNEALGIDSEAIALCDGVVSLPMFGDKASINVGNSCAAVLYAVLNKSGIRRF